MMLRTMKICICMVIFCLLCGVAAASKYSAIDHTQLKELIEADQHDFLLIDARNPEEYRESHIPGAINIPQKNFDDYIGLLPTDKDTTLILYCNGVKCGKSKKVAAQAMAVGYTDVRVFAEGMPVWEEIGYSFYKSDDYETPIETVAVSSSELSELLETQPEAIQIVDVRDPEEFAQGHIPGAVNCPLKNFAQKSDILDKNRKVIVYCNSGGRSAKAYRKLMRLGFKDIGQALFADWREAGLNIAI